MPRGASIATDSIATLHAVDHHDPQPEATVVDLKIANLSHRANRFTNDSIEWRANRAATVRE